MCGLMGYCGREKAAPHIVEGLRRLEYRGYDSAGLATLADHAIHLRKDSGKLNEVEQKHGLSQLPGSTGIGHVRWATHGSPTQVNAHPHLDCCRNIAVVHNGILENGRELAAALAPRHHFLSETDTEVIPHLLDDHMQQGATLTQATLAAARKITGPNAFLAISAAEPEKIVAFCHEMPLLIGLGKTGSFVSSDLASFPPECTQVLALDDREVAVITPQGVSCFDDGGKPVLKEAHTIAPGPWDDGTDRLGYYMLKEIGEQPWAMQQAMLQRRELLDKCVLDILRARQTVFTASGTSRFAALLGRYLFSRVAKRFSDVVAGSEFKYFSDSIDRETVVIAVSQSGETADVLSGVRESKKQGARILSIVNRAHSQLERLSDETLFLNCGPEIAVAATKSFTAQLTIFYLLAYGMAGQLELAGQELHEASGKIAANLKPWDESARQMAERLKGAKSCFLIARGSNLHVANEAALKVKEVAYVHAEGLPAGELKHGSLALLERGTPVIAVCPGDYTFDDTIANVEEAKARGAYIVGVSDRQNAVFDEWLRIPTVSPACYPLVSIVPMQLFAYYLALARGFNPDKPRNLAKSVTVG